MNSPYLDSFPSWGYLFHFGKLPKENPKSIFLLHVTSHFYSYFDIRIILAENVQTGFIILFSNPIPAGSRVSVD